VGNDNHVVVSHKLCGSQGRVGGCVVVIKEPIVVVPKLLSFSSHIFSQASQNVTVKVRADRSVRGNRFNVNNPLHVTPGLPAFFALDDCGSSSATIVAWFLDHIFFYLLLVGWD
jgi:hypothetical protein